MRTTNSLANWLLTECKDDSYLSEGTVVAPITFGEAFKKLKLKEFKVAATDAESNKAEDTEFGINFYPSKKILVKGVEDYPVVNVFIKAGKKTASVDAVHETTGDHLFTVKFEDLADLVAKLGELDVLAAWKKYVAKVEKKSSVKILKEAADVEEEEKEIDAAKAIKIADKIAKLAEKNEDETLEKLVADLKKALGVEDEKEEKEEKAEKPAKKGKDSDEDFDF